ISASTGKAAYDFILSSIRLAKAGLVDGVSTAPINKEALNLAGVKEPGHTEIFANETATEKFCMMMTSEIITCSLVTVHVGYREVPAMLTAERIVEVIELTRAAMSRIRGREPKMVVCGLNPHAGEGGLFGNREEENIILPAMERARAAGADLVGPLPPDTAFLDWRRAETDAYICMYHDQGLIPLKALAFDEAINVTLGLPIVRTSVDHGTALDIAWQGKANPGSIVEAVRLAARLTEA
ncbi:MAG: 4-hydroxythreonine-4-phosphate dehydrogenase PdxA, partial [Verrucomicrobiales bacterium]|nr:4-hydroxythreonine-4-phosphate dehydrogenase PdxA [Verrucomicrobiales bacterium]